MRRSPVDQPYTEIAPPADLAPYVDRFWLRTSTADPARIARVPPDGCVDLIVHAERGAAELVGTMTRALEIHEAHVELISVRFKPGTGAAVARCALAELTDQRADAVALGVADAALVDRVIRAGSGPARVAVLAGWLRGRLADAPRPDPMVARAVALLSSRASPRVAEVAAQLGVTRQYLARVFRCEVGITPKQLARIARMQRAIAALGRGGLDARARAASGGIDPARLAVELGYFDQSHLVHELRDLLGATPAMVAREPPTALTHLFPFLQSPARATP